MFLEWIEHYRLQPDVCICCKPGSARDISTKRSGSPKAYFTYFGSLPCDQGS